MSPSILNLPTRNVKRSFLSGRDKATTRSKKSVGREKSTIKGKYIVKAEDQPLKYTSTKIKRQKIIKTTIK